MVAATHQGGRLRQWIQDEYARLGYTWFDRGDLNLNLVAVRAIPGEPNRFDDVVAAVYKRFGHWEVQYWPCTTDPGRFYLNEPLNEAGTAILVPGQYPSSHHIGRHRDRYPALVQRGPVCVWRDNNRDEVVDYGATGEGSQGYYGINIHGSSQNPFESDKVSAAVEKWSAGCVVFQRDADYRQFWSLIEEASQRWGPRFTFTLLEGPASSLVV